MSLLVAFVGPESCGKTTLTLELQQQLRHLNISSCVVPEYARHYYADRPYEVSMQDIELIADGQQQLEQQAQLAAPQVILCDTTRLTCKIWADVAFGAASQKLHLDYPAHYYDLTFLLAPDIAWQFDPLRSHPTERQWLFELYEQELQQCGISYHIVRGEGLARQDSALKTLLAYLAAPQSDPIQR